MPSAKGERFPPYRKRLWEADRCSGWSHDRAEGKNRRGRVEERIVTTYTRPCRYLREELGWSGVQQIMQYRTIVERQGKVTSEVHYAITNLPRSIACADELLRYRRGRWGIENRTFYVRDTAYREDQSSVRVGQLPRVMASFRNASIDFLRGLGETNIARALRQNAYRIDRLLPKLGISNN